MIIMDKRRSGSLIKVIPVLALVISIACGFSKPKYETEINRYERIPEHVLSHDLLNDFFPPVSNSSEWENPIPIKGYVNSPGAEDNPVILPDGETLYFFFTPDVTVAPEVQVLDGVSGVWRSQMVLGQWEEATRIRLSNDLSLDSAMVVLDDTMWFISARGGNYRPIDIYTASKEDDQWKDWENVGKTLNESYNVGEFWIDDSQTEMIFHAEKEDGYGGLDLWKTYKIDDSWSLPQNLGPAVNSFENESHPFVSPDGEQLFITGKSNLGYAGPAIYRSIKNNDSTWGKPEEIISNFAGDASVDNYGNIYFTHHYFDEKGQMLEADIFVAYHK